MTTAEVLAQLQNIAKTLSIIHSRNTAWATTTNRIVKNYQTALSHLQAMAAAVPTVAAASAATATSVARTAGVSASAAHGAINATNLLNTALGAVIGHVTHATGALGKMSGPIGRIASSLAGVGIRLGTVLGGTGLVHSYIAAVRLNDTLIDTNVELKNRNHLLYTAIQAQLQLGVGFTDVFKAQEALVKIGLKYDAGLRDQVETVVMLEKGLGVSNDLSAELALNAKVIGANFRQVAGVVAMIVDGTRLTGEQSAKIALELAKVNRELGLSGKNLPQVSAAVASIESAVKGLGATDGLVTKLIQNFSTLQGVGNAVMFGGSKGIFDPKMFQDADKMSEMVLNVGKRLDQMTGGNPLMLSAFEPMLQKMGMTITDARAVMALYKDPTILKSQLNQMKEAIDRRKEMSALEERFNDQMASSSEAFVQFKDRFMAIVKIFGTPFLTALNLTLRGINAVLTPLIKLAVIIGNLAPFGIRLGRVFQALGVTAIGLVLIPAVIGATLAATRLSIAMARLAVSMTIAEFAAKRRLAGLLRSQVARRGLLPTAARLLGIRGISSTATATATGAASAARTAAMVASRLLIIVAAATAIAATVKAIHDAIRSRKDQKKAELDAIAQAAANAKWAAAARDAIANRIAASRAAPDTNSRFAVSVQRSLALPDRPETSAVVPVNAAKSSAEATARLRESRQHREAFDALKREVIELRKAVKSGDDAKLKSDQKISTTENGIERLRWTSDLLRSTSSPTYGAR